MSVIAQVSDISFERYSVSEGLANSSVVSIAQDSNGYLWIGTLNGLHKYDGLKFNTFLNIKGDSSSISGNFIKSVFVDSRGEVWIGTLNAGVNRNIRGTNGFEIFRTDTKSMSTISSDKITAITEDRKGNLWIGTEGSGINRYDRETGKFERFRLQDGYNNVHCLFADPKNDIIWIGTESGGLIKFDYEAKEFKTFINNPTDEFSIEGNYVRSLIVDSKGKVWVGIYNKGLFWMDPENERFYNIEDTSGELLSSAETIYSIHEDSEGTIWAGTAESGLIKYNVHTKAINKFTFDKSDPISLSSKTVLSIFVDKIGILWVGTDRGGLCKYDKAKSIFSIISNEKYKDFNINNGFIHSLIKDSRGNIWVGYDNGLEKISPDLKRIERISGNFDDQGDNSSFFVNSLYEDNNGDIWVGTISSGLFRYSDDKVLVRYDVGFLGGNSKRANITAILRDSDNDLWVATDNRGLFIYSDLDDSFIPFTKVSLTENGWDSSYIYCLLSDNNSLWIGTFGDGLYKYDKINKKINHYRNISSDTTSISNDFILTLFEDSKGNIWMGHLNEGISKYNAATDDFSNHSQDGLLTNDETYSIIEDDKGNLWFGANKRIVKFSDIDHSFTNFNTRYWLNNNEIVRSAVFKDDNGDLYFGGVKGISFFNPDSVLKIVDKPKVSISSVEVEDYLINNVLVNPETQIPYIELPYDKNAIYFTYSLIDFRVPEENKFSVILENNDDYWSPTDNLSYLYYDELAAGEYTFRVKGSNHFGVIDGVGDSFRIIIHPPLWGTWWFKSFGAIFVLFSLFMLDKRRIHKIEHKKIELEKTISERTFDLQEKQNELLLIREELEKRVEERTSELRYQNIQLNKEVTDRIDAEMEKSKLQDQLLHAQKMESIGRLAGGVAHDFNNILMGIMGYADLLKTMFPDPKSVERVAVDIILDGSEKASHLTKQLLGFARGGKYNPVPVEINNCIDNSLKVAATIFKKNVEVITNYGKIPNVIADVNQLDQVFTNLLINARDAMPSGGELHISTNVVNLTEEFVKTKPELKACDYVEICVTDSGVGMSKEISERIFEPFFTTKSIEKGTGLGMATVYGIIKNHNGIITVNSEPGVGTTFKILLPVTDRETIKAKKDPDVIEGEGTILVVDDEKHVRIVAENMLISLGYNVILANDGNEALKKYNENSDKINLVLLDIIMPNKDGKDTFLALKEINPDIRTVLMSGFSQEGKASELIKQGVLGFVQKPFRVAQLSKVISDVLSETKG